MYLAFDGLTPDVQAMVRPLKAIHSNEGFLMGLQAKGSYSDEEMATLRDIFPATTHPVVRTHPWTGREVLYVNIAFAHAIEGMDRASGFQLLQGLYAAAAIPEYQCRFKWEKHSIAFWVRQRTHCCKAQAILGALTPFVQDNRSTQHYAISDYFPSKRTVERVTVIGDRPYYSPGTTVPGPGTKPWPPAPEHHPEQAPRL